MKIPVKNLLCIVVLFAINAYICRELFTAEFIHQMGSVEGSFIAISRWAMQHWGDLAWFPLWFTGMPFHQIYQPGFHLTVAATGTLFHLSPQHAYHLVNAIVYCLQPITLFWLCYRVTGWRGYAFAVALAYSLISPAAFLSNTTRVDLGTLWMARRYQTLVHYGEGPHNAALMLLPLVILFLHWAVTERRRLYFPFACLALAAVVLTNWPGSIGLTMAIIAYCLSRIGGSPRIHWLTLAATAVLAYLISCRWVPPSIVLSVPGNARQSDGTSFHGVYFAYLFLAALVLFGLHLLFQRLHAGPWLRFFAYFALISGAVVQAKLWAGISFLPQPHRFQLEMEMGLIGAGVYVARLFYLNWPRRIQTAAIAAVVGCGKRLRRPRTAGETACPTMDNQRFTSLGGAGIQPARVFFRSLVALLAIVQIHNYRAYAISQTLPQNITSTIEYRMSHWFETNMHRARVFAPGSVSIWMNAFNDVPQMVGCCDQGVPTFEHRLAYFTIYTASNAGERYLPVALLWLKAYGAQAIGVSGPNAKEFFKPYARPEAFHGELPELWRDGDDVIYQVPTRAPSLAHVISPTEMVSRAPVHGLDVEPLVPYVSALDRADSGADFHWIDAHQARIQALVRKGQILSVQETYDPGWRAMVNGVRRPLHADPLGLMVIEPACDGACTIDLIFDGGPEARWTRWAQLLGLLLCLAWPIFAGKTTRQ